MFCQFKDIFGKPHEGVHRYRIPIPHLNPNPETHSIALVDTIGTLLIAILISYYYSSSSDHPPPFYLIVFFSFVGLLLFSIIIHKLFCVNTTLTRLVFQ